MLTNIDTIFKKKLFRIPDYQRGYAWQLQQLTDFWEDINTLEDDKNHYTGVLSLEEVPELKWSTWNDDKWIIENKSYTPYFVVDGQQRLLTCIILIQAIIETALELPQNQIPNNENFELCDTEISEIRKDFIFRQRKNSIIRSYIFSYEEDNPSYEYLKTKVFNESSSSDRYQETLYTLNLENAKKFFKDNLSLIPVNERTKNLETIFKKVTQHLLFNEYVIQGDVDVFVAFETMNNRGKKLSDLELLKNRLIYLTTLYRKDDPEKSELRKQINHAWKDIYYYLGKNKVNRLNDDDFLKAHWIMYFKYSRKKGKDYIRFLLDDQFSPKKVIEQVPIVLEIKDAIEVRDISDDELNDTEDTQNETQITATQSVLSVEEVSAYATSMKDSSEQWFKTFNPFLTNYSPEEKKWLDCLNRIGIGYFRPLVMSSFTSKKVTVEERIKLFKSIERFIFIAFRLSQARGNYGDSEFYKASKDLYYGTTDVDAIVNLLNERLAFTFNDGIFKLTKFQDFISDNFNYGSKDGFYGWRGIRYFLYEYEQHLFGQSKDTGQKITWGDFINSGDKVSIEHILPQTADKKCWQDSFRRYLPTELSSLTNTLGNLLALSQPKNSSLQNECYAEKRADKKTARGYFNGSYSENRVAELYQEWTAEQIKSRGLELLSFMEERWNIKLGDESTKLNLLNIDFLETM